MNKICIYTDEKRQAVFINETKSIAERLDTALKAFGKIGNVAPLTIEELLDYRHEKVNQVEVLVRKKSAEFFRANKGDIPFNTEKLMEIIDIGDFSEFSEAMIAIPGMTDKNKAYNTKLYQVNGDNVKINQEEVDKYCDQVFSVYLETDKQKRIFDKVTQLKEILEELKDERIMLGIHNYEGSAGLLFNSGFLLNKNLNINYPAFRSIK